MSGLRRFIGNWGILVIGVCAILAFIGVATYLAPATPPAASSASNSQSTLARPPAAQPRTAAQTSPPAAAVKPAQPSAPPAPASQPPAVNSASAQSRCAGTGATCHADARHGPTDQRPSSATGCVNEFWRGRCRSRPAGLPQMPSLPLARGGQESCRPVAGRRHRTKSRHAAELQLFAVDEASQYHLGCQDARRLFGRSAKTGARKQNAVPWA